MMLLNPLRLFRNLWQHRELIVALIRRDLGQQYRGSYLGVIWSIISPLAMLMIYTFMFAVVYKSKWPGSNGNTSPGDYAIILFAGLAAFNLFSSSANRSPTIILGSANYVKKVVFPLEILPVVVVGSSLVNSLIISALIVVIHWLAYGWIPAAIVLLPLAYIPLILLSLAAAWFLSALGVFLRDVGHAVGIVMQMLLFGSPIFYPFESVPARFRPIFLINPLTTIIDAFRRALIWDTMIPWKMWGLVTLALSILMMFCYAWFMKLKKGFADVM